MSKPIYDFDTLNTPIWEPSSNAIEHILSILPTYDYEFMDIISHKPHDDNMITISEFLFRISKILLDKQMIKADKDGILTYKEGTYTIKYGFNRKHKDLIVGIMITNKTEDPFKLYNNDTSFMLAFKIDMDDYNFIKTYILNKCIRNKEYYKKIFHRLYGLSR
jgi:hypothetical protein